MEGSQLADGREERWCIGRDKKKQEWWYLLVRNVCLYRREMAGSKHGTCTEGSWRMKLGLSNRQSKKPTTLAVYD